MQPARFGNTAAKCQPHARNSLIEHERCVLAYAFWLADDGCASLRSEVASRLRGRRLLCHCYPLPCHAEVLAAMADDTSATLAAMRPLRTDASTEGAEDGFVDRQSLHSYCGPVWRWGSAAYQELHARLDRKSACNS